MSDEKTAFEDMFPSAEVLAARLAEAYAERDALRAEVERLSSALAEQESRANKFHEQAEANALETTELRRAICEAMGYSTKVVYPSDAEIATRVQALHERCAHQDAAFIKGAPHDEADGCPTFYDGCNCTVETLVHNIRRAERAEEERDNERWLVMGMDYRNHRLLRAAQSLHRAWRRERNLVDRYQRDHDDWMWTTDKCDCAICDEVRDRKSLRSDARDGIVTRLRAFVRQLQADGLDIDDPTTAPVWTGKIHDADGRLLFDLATARACAPTPYSAICHPQTLPDCAGCPDDAVGEASGREPRGTP